MAEGSGNFSATPEEITAAANRVVGTHMPKYTMSVVRLYNAVEKLAEAWPGTDGEVFVNVIKEKRAGIAQILEVLGQYTQFMKEAAANMDDTQTGISGAASNL